MARETVIAVLADTHVPARAGFAYRRALPRQLYERLTGADLILHAGDVTEAPLLEELTGYAPVRAVRGNWDSHPSVASLPETLEFELGGVNVAMIHDAGYTRGRIERLRDRFPGAGVIIFGHSHIPYLEYDDGLLLVNPGPAAETFAVLRTGDGKVRVELLRSKVKAKSHAALLRLSVLPVRPTSG